MAQAYVGQKRIRRYYGNIREVLEMPNLIEVQKSSYDLFLRSGEAEGHQRIDGADEHAGEQRLQDEFGHVTSGGG